MAGAATLANVSQKQMLDEDTRLLLGRELGQAFADSWNATNDLRAQVEVRRDQYEGLLDDKPLEWSANNNYPVTKHQIRTAAIQIARTALGTDPIFEVEADDPRYDEAAQNVEAFNQFWHERTRLRSKGYIAILESLITGQAWLKPGIRATGKQIPDITMMMPDEPITVDQLDVIPTCDYVVTEDMMLLPATAPSFRRAKGAFARTILRWNDIMQAKRRKAFYEDAIERLKLTWQEELTVSQTHEQQGIAETTPSEIWSAEFECWEGIYRWAIPGTDEEIEWLILAAYSVDREGDAIILRCEPYRPLFGDQWFFTPIITDPKPNSLWGGSLVENIRGLQNFINSMFNACTDAVQITLLPPLAMSPAAYAQRRNLVWGPLAKWPVMPNDVAPIMSSGNSLAAVQAGLGMVDMARQMSERVVGVSDPTSGRPSQEKRTAYELSLVAQSSSQIFEHHVVMVQIGPEEGCGLESYAEMMMQIIRRFLPKQPLLYRSGGQGQSPFHVMKPEYHDGKYRFIARGNSATSNPEVRGNRAQAVMQSIGQNPFAIPGIMDSPEMIVEKAKRIYKAYNEYYQAMGVKHPESYIGGEPETFEEAIRVVAVINPQVAMQLMEQYQMQMAQYQMQMAQAQASANPMGVGAAPGAGAYPGAAGAGGAGGIPGVPGLGAPAGMGAFVPRLGPAGYGSS